MASGPALVNSFLFFSLIELATALDLDKTEVMCQLHHEWPPYPWIQVNSQSLSFLFGESVLIIFLSEVFCED